jgi:ribosomal protein L10
LSWLRLEKQTRVFVADLAGIPVTQSHLCRTAIAKEDSPDDE